MMTSSTTIRMSISTAAITPPPPDVGRAGMAFCGRTGVLFEGLLARPKIDVGLVVVCGVTVGRGIGGLVRIGGGGTVAFVFAVEFPAPTRFQPVTPPGPDQEICGTSGRRA